MFCFHRQVERNVRFNEGARQYYERDEPGFVQHWSEPIALLFSVLAVAWGIGVALREFILNQRKDTLDVYFERVDELTTELVRGPTAERATEIAKDLHAIRRETTRKLVAEELAAFLDDEPQWRFFNVDNSH